MLPYLLLSIFVVSQFWSCSNFSLVPILVLSQFWSCSDGNDDDDLRHAAVCCQSAWPPRVSVLTAHFHAFAEYSTAHVLPRKATMSALAIQLFIQRNTLLWGGQNNNMQAGVRPANFRPNPICRANNRDVCANMVLLISKLSKMKFASDSRNLSKLGNFPQL